MQLWGEMERKPIKKWQSADLNQLFPANIVPFCLMHVFFSHLNFKSSYTTSPLVATMWKKMLHAPEANALQPIRERPSVQTLLTNHTALFVLRIIFHIERNRWRAVKKRYAKKKTQKKNKINNLQSYGYAKECHKLSHGESLPLYLFDRWREWYSMQMNL